MKSAGERSATAVYFLVATLAISILAWVATQGALVPGLPRLEYRIFYRLFAFTDEWGALLQIGLIDLVFAVPALRPWGERLAAFCARNPRGLAIASFAAFAILARFVYLATPFSMDEYSQVSQAYAFAHGHLTWFEPPALLDRMIPTGFRNFFFAVNPQSGEVASLYWPGFALLLTPFALIGMPWILNPLLGALTLLLIHAIVRKLCASALSAGWATLLTIASPMFAVNSISLYSMPAHLALNLLFVWWLIDGRASRALLAGLAGSLALVLHNPVPHLLFAVPWIIWLACDGNRRKSLLALAIGYLPCLAVGFGWPLVTRAIEPPSSMPLNAVNDFWHLFFDKLSSVLALPTHNLAVARADATWKIWIWSVPGLLIVSTLALRTSGRALRLLAASLALTYVFYWLVPFDQGHGWGYRYIYSAWAALPLLAAAYLTRDAVDDQIGSLRPWMGGFALASLIAANGFWFWQVHAVISEHLAQRIAAPANGRWLIFVTPRRGLYSWDMIQNLPFDSQRIILMSFGADADQALTAAMFPGAERKIADARGSLWQLPNR